MGSRCPNCRASLRDRVSRCPSCSARLARSDPGPAAAPEPPPPGGSEECPECGEENPADYRFCDACGAWFGAGCPACGGPARSGARFCGFCGRPMPESPGKVEPHSPRQHRPPVQPAAVPGHPAGDLAEFHRRAVREYAGLWFDPELRAAREVTAEDAAYHLCQHAALLGRVTGNPAAVGGLFRLPVSDRTRLLEAVGVYLRGLSLAPTAAAALGAEAVEPEDLERLEDLLIARDGLEEVLRLAADLAATLPGGGPDATRSALALAAASAAEFDDLLNRRTDVLSVLGDPLAGMRQGFRGAVDTNRSWWFTRPQELAREAESGSLADLVPPAPPVDRPNPLAAPPARPAAATPVQPTPERGFVLSAATAAGGQASAYLRCRAEPAFGGLLLALRPGTYQFLALDPQRQRTAALDGAEIIARFGGVVVGRESVVEGAAVFAARDVQTCAVRTADGVEWELVSEE